MSAARKPKSETLRDVLLAQLKKAAQHNRSDVAPPAAVLWTDRERHWERIVPNLRAEATILTLGDYDHDALVGPAIWIRCAIAGTLPDVPVGDGPPVIYLPGVGKSDLRAVESCPRYLQPLAELQYRGALFTHKNGKDMTPAGLLASIADMEVSTDRETASALSRALPHLMDERTSRLAKMSPLQADDLDEMLVEDPERDLLLWLDDPKAYINLRGDEVYEAFHQVCRREYRFDPVTDGDLRAAELLTGGAGQWKTVWKRFEEAPDGYPNLPSLLDRVSGPTQGALFEEPSPYRPADNLAEEDRLREGLASLAPSDVSQARQRLKELEEIHGRRREWVWSKMGHAPLAGALSSLFALSSLIAQVPEGETPEQLAEWYTVEGWKVDDLALKSLASVKTTKDAEAVKVTVRAVYAGWLESASRRFQKAVGEYSTVSAPQRGIGSEGPESGVCILFVDGLRYDLAQRLSHMLSPNETDIAWRFTALPGVTPTAKPCLSPVASQLGPGGDLGAAINGSKVTATNLRKAISDLGYGILTGHDTGDPAGGAWAEFGDIDNLGHNRGSRMARELESALGGIAERVEELFDTGWREVRIVTDHGWLMLPGGLPKVELPEHLTVTRKGRCARMKADSSISYQTVPWTLDSQVSIVVAPGSGVFQGTDEYEHGGLSLQECVVPVLTARSTKPVQKIVPRITEVRWTGLRCRVSAEDYPEGAVVDLRSSAADPRTSLTVAKPLKGDSSSLPVEDDRREGEAALVVLLDTDGRPLTKYPTVVGGD